MSNRTSSSRRRALALLATSGAGMALGKAAVASDEKAVPPGAARRFGMAIDLDRCLRCHACVVACASENNIAPLGAAVAAQTRPIHWMDMLMPDVGAGASEIGRGPAPIPCMHCEQPECAKVCPVGATSREDDGVVVQIWERCIGCRYCMAACPYSRRYFNWTEPSWPGGDTNCLNPDVASRPAGVVEKCTFCGHRIRAVYEQARIDGETVADPDLRRLPACAAACPTRAITFGDLADPGSTLSQLVKSPRAIQLCAHLGTGPKVYYLLGKR
jgi:menaquinone reductase, iron-sulfur cluster-binding subunit